MIYYQCMLGFYTAWSKVGPQSSSADDNIVNRSSNFPNPQDSQKGGLLTN